VSPAYQTTVLSALRGMRLYVAFDLLNRESGPSGVAYALLRQAGHRPSVEYIPGSSHGAGMLRLTGHSRPPVLVTTAGEVVAGVHMIADWVAERGAAR
jgi:hypothetical protein